MKLSIKWILILGCLAMVWGTHLITTTSSYVTSQRVLSDHARDIMENIAELAMEQARNHLALAQGATHLTKRLLAGDVVGSKEEQIGALEQYFFDQLAIYPHFAGIYLGLPTGEFYYVSRNEGYPGSAFRTKLILVRDGIRETHVIWRDRQFREIHRTTDPDDTYDPRARPWYRKALEQKRIVWTEPYIFFTSQKPGITIAGPTTDTRRALKGIVGVDIEIDQLSLFIGKLRIGKNGRAFMFNHNEDVVAFHDLDRIMFKEGEGPGKTRLVKIGEIDDVLCRRAFESVDWLRDDRGHLLLDGPLFARFEYLGKKYHVMFRPFGTSQWPWIIGVYLPEDDYLGSIKRNQRLNVLMAFLISVLATLAGLRFLRGIIRPIGNLEKAAVAVKNRDYDAVFDTHSPYKEIQETADSFSHMKDAIVEGEKKLQAYQDHLEDLVEERTGELKAVNQKLIREIEERRAAQEALKKREAQYKELYEKSKSDQAVYRSFTHSSPDAIAIFDRQGKVGYVSPSFTSIFGWTLEELAGGTIPFVPESEKEATRATFRRIVKEGTPVRAFETKRLTKDGILLDVSISSSRYDDHQGNPAGLIAIIRDITDTKKLQVQLQHSQKMESIGTIASGVAHNFRNILAGLSVNSQLIRVKHQDVPGILDISARMDDYVRRGARLVDSLTQFSRKQSEIQLRGVNLTDVILETSDLVTKSFDRRIQLQLDVDDFLPVRGDEASLKQVLMNLCTNARDAMPDGGVLFLTGRRVGAQVEVRVRDTGVGMDPEVQKSCFDPFFTTKDVDKGTGLGLSTTYGIIKEHGGQIHLESECGKGTTFRILLPLHSVQEEIRFPVEDEVQTGQGMSLLIVDDEIEMIETLAELLGKLGYRTYTTASGKDALEQFRRHRPDAVLLDRNMPGMEGIRCAVEILKMDPEARVIILSGYDEDSAPGLDAELKKRISGYITKPVDINELTGLLSRLFEKKRAVV